MLTIKKYVKAKSLEEAYELNQKKTNVILGGFMWLKMGNRTIQTAIDLSGLGLDQIEETAEDYKIGAMCTLRDLELHEGLNHRFQGVFKAALKSIVGVQFRNGATVGGTIAGRYGFSDLLTCLMALDCRVELFKAGLVPIAQYAQMKRDNDILIRIHIKKDGRRIAYYAQRNSKTDFPVIAVAVARKGGDFFTAVGARPMKAVLLERQGYPLDENAQDEEIIAFADSAAAHFTYGGNMRAGREYRRQLAAVYIKRAVKDLLGGKQA